MKKMFNKVGLGIMGVLGSAGLALAEPTVTVPSVDTQILTDSGTAIFAAVAIFVAIAMGLRLFKRG